MDRRTFMKLLISAAIIAALFSVVNPWLILSHVAETDLEIYLLGVAVFFLTYPLNGHRWKKLSEGIGYELSLSEATRMISVAYSFNKLFPGNSGDLVRSKIFERYRDVNGHSPILGIVVMERFLDVLSVFSIILASLIFVASGVFTTISWILVPFAVFIVGMTVILGLSEDHVRFFTGLLPYSFSDRMDALIDGYRSLSRRELLYNLLVSYTRWMLEILSFYILALSLGLGLGIWDIALVSSSMSLISALPISPGGVGPVEATGTGLLVLAGITSSMALSLVILRRSVTLLLVGFAGALVYWTEEFTGVK